MKNVKARRDHCEPGAVEDSTVFAMWTKKIQQDGDYRNLRGDSKAHNELGLALMKLRWPWVRKMDTPNRQLGPWLAHCCP